MLDSIINLAKEHLVPKLSENTELSPEQANESVKIGSESVFDTLKNELLSGNFSGIQNLISGDITNNPIVDNIASNFITGLVEKLGVPESTAKSVAQMSLPYILNIFKGKAGEIKDNPAKIAEILNTGNSDGGMLGQVGNILGGLFK